MTSIPAGVALDERSHYEVAAAVVHQVSKLARHLPDEDAVWRAFARWRGAELAEYVQTVRQTRHSIFYYQLQHLYEFGIENVPAEHRESFCFQAGQHFGRVLLGEAICPVLQLALAKPGTFQFTVVEMLRMHLVRFSGNRYGLEAEFRPHELILSIQDRAASFTAGYLNQYGLIPERCFRNSLHFIAGTVDGFISHLIKDYQPGQNDFNILQRCGVIRLAVAENSSFNYEWLLQTLMGFLQQVQARQRVEVKETQLESDLVVASSSMREAWDKIRRASQSDEVVLLLGESGTGKTFIAQKIHSLSRRCQGPFIAVGLTSDLGSDNLVQSNLFGHERGAFTGATEQKQGLFSLAHGGTILLDEIGDASPELQAKLLRVIDSCTFKRLGGLRDIRVDVRIIAATHRPLEAMVREGKFRQDLYYRLNVIPIQVPPLRHRPESIPALADFLLTRITESSGRPSRKLSPALCALLQNYPWPGNVRELDHALRYAVAMSDAEILTLSEFPNAIRSHLQTQPEPAAGVGLADPPPAHGGVLDSEALRLCIRASDPRRLAGSACKYDFPCHVDFARRAYLATLIEECKGDLSLIGHYWDHHSEKTLRTLIQAFGLGEQLRAARLNSSRSADSESKDLPQTG